jgi:hypothetical protein
MEVLQSSTAGYWVERQVTSETGVIEFLDLPCSGCPVTAVSDEMLQRADPIIHKD